PVPLYHQIAEEIRYRISTGALSAGAALPTLRGAAERWGVNLHTVRRAYAELAAIGLVRIRRPTGAVVLGKPDSSPRKAAARDTLKGFVDRVLEEARERHDLSPLELAGLLTVRPVAAGPHRVAVVECSEAQCADLAAQLERRWEVNADRWCLARSDDLPDSEIVATYFHYNDIRRRWPRRLASVHFVAIQPDASLPGRVAAWRRRGPPEEILVCERDPTMLAMICADLSNLFPARRYKLTPLLIKDGRPVLARGDKRLRLLAPRIWGGLTTEQRADPCVMEIRYIFDSEQIERLAAQLEWPERQRLEERTA